MPRPALPQPFSWLLEVVMIMSKICSDISSSKEAKDGYNLYSFLARLPLHIFCRKMMMPGIN